MEENKKFHWIYVLALCYVAAVYMAPVLSFLLGNNVEDGSNLPFYPIGIPILLGIINFIIIHAKKDSIGRVRLLKCAVLIKYAMIPIYILGGLLIAICLLLMFTPVVIMVFVGPAVAIMLSFIGWLYMIGTAPYSLAYISESRKNGVHGRILCRAAAILQFFFIADVISIMVLALKEKRCVKSTLLVLAILILGFIGCVVWLVVQIMSCISI